MLMICRRDIVRHESICWWAVDLEVHGALKRRNEKKKMLVGKESGLTRHNHSLQEVPVFATKLECSTC